jgi:hypothetical protein
LRDPLISPHYRLSDWRQLDFHQKTSWLKAIDIVEDRIRGRFIDWVDSIADKRFSGFAVIALDCLLLETIYGFQSGRASEGRCCVYEAFLTGSKHFGFDRKTARLFCENIRNGLIHDTETRKKWLIEQTQPPGKIIEQDSEGNFVLNRSLFHCALKAEFSEWISQMRAGDADARKKMKARMEQIIDRHFQL